MYPKASSLIESNTDNEELLRVYPSYYANIPLSILFVLLVAMVYGLTWSVETQPLFLTLKGSFFIRFIPVFPAMVLIEIIRRRHNHLYVITNENITHYSGRLSFRYNVPIVKYTDIRGLSVKQSFFGRIFDYGNISIGTSAQDDSEIIIYNVDAPEEFATLIDEMREEALKKNPDSIKHQKLD